MMKISRRYFLFSIPIIVGLLSYIASRIMPMNILRLPLLTVSSVSIVFAIYSITNQIYDLPKLTIRHSRLIDIIIFLMIFLAVVTGRVVDSGIHDYFYILVITTSGLLAYQILVHKVHLVICLFQLILLALTIRSALWFSYPVYGQDRFHHAAVGYIISTGEIVPESVTYYANFPQAHVLAATSTLITDTSLKTGYFTLGIIVSISILAVFLLGEQILQNDRGALLAVLFVVIGSYHIRSGSEPFAQALFTSLAPFIFYYLFNRDINNRQMMILIGMVIFGVTVQNIAPLVLLGVGAAFLISTRIIEYIERYFGINTSKLRTINTNIIIIAGIVGIMYYSIAGYLRFQTMRVYWIFHSLFSQGSSESVEKATEGSVPTIDLLGYELPSLLMWAGPILALASVLLFVVYLLLFEFICGQREFSSLGYIISTGGIFAIFSVVFVIRSGGATRALPYIIILLSPVFGWLALQIARNRETTGTVLVILLVLSISFTGVLTPIVAKPELTDEEFKPYLESNQVAAVEFASDYTSATMSSGYIAGYERVWRVSQGDHPNGLQIQGGSYQEASSTTENQGGPHIVIRGVLQSGNSDSIAEYKSQSQRGETTMYSDHFKSTYDIDPPQTNQVYSSGSTKIYTG